MTDPFISVPLTFRTVDLYIARRSIEKAMAFLGPSLTGDLLDVGCGRMPYKNMLLDLQRVRTYTGLDIQDARDYGGDRADVYWDGRHMPFEDGSFDSALSTEVLEHVFEPLAHLREVVRVLKPGGVYAFTVPFCWPLHEVPHDAYRYTPFTLNSLLVQSGFEQVELFPLGGWNAALGQMIGLWARRHVRPGLMRQAASLLAVPVVGCLYHLDKVPQGFQEGQMITGLFGLARKAGKS